MHFQISHTKTKTEAKQKVKDAIEGARPHMKEQVVVKEERWDGDTFHFLVDLQGKQVTGTLLVTDTDFIIDAKLPLLWRLFEGRIEKEIAKQVAGLR
ncbi:hypothetical protein A2765_01480 [Candidatus Kaiserbacteria bacterium RIFCSPHIGHO2_01_FULL_56_24]|uniref:Polyhydroxyalkanoic acid system protein n=1 Tax=Candidatus Kaiserbacteria bacterium RIFCSPHIGHO2_01_FULL_56_24 TaxID=1798487 RepID=A0A1F6DHH8_9BACT|nr:MAG: hypothetical protein A2765_01480 [Candidatus Kaiserbacteria bacterium RIFCSPHIGHO2_01_FULL_56_24]